jgi:1-acyl-sn-glycerol-3-phosphate acyltransferase
MMTNTTNSCPPFPHGNSYHSPQLTPGWLARTFPTFTCYTKLINIVWRSSRLAKVGRYDDRAWYDSSVEVVRALESVGCQLHVTGLQHLGDLNQPCIFIGNHMSTLETFVLPSLIMTKVHNLTFIIKRSLIDYPVFKHVMRSRNPVVVDRVNPREDLKVVMEEGAKRIADGYSLVIFPQHTRTIEFDPGQFNTIGVKLARKTGAPVIPMAMLTWAWSPGSLLKDYGPIIPSRPIHFAFDALLEVTGRGIEEHEQIIRFIQGNLEKWRAKDGQS